MGEREFPAVASGEGKKKKRGTSSLFQQRGGGRSKDGRGMEKKIYPFLQMPRGDCSPPKF